MDRRQALLLLGKGACAALATQSLAACTSNGPARETVVSLDSIPEDGRLEIDHLGRPVELLRTGDAVEARSLWCTHFGCVVRWEPDRREYLCPCHDGLFDARGRPIGGPPTVPLCSLPVTVAGDIVTVGGT